MNFTQIKIPPGVFRNGTQYQAMGRYFDANLVRWQEGVLKPIGGWTLLTQEEFEGRARSLLQWRDNSGFRYLAVGTNAHLYVWSDRGDLRDVTPVGFQVGRIDSIYGAGFGYGTFGTGEYGTVRDDVDTVVLPAASWQFDNWGENLVACAFHDGGLYEWSLDVDEKAQIIANAPTNNRGLIVTPERHLVLIGAGGNPRRVQWSDREDNTTWTPTATNTAGSVDLQTNGLLQRAVLIRGQILLFTDQDLHLMTFVGAPFTYGVDIAGRACGLTSPNGVAVVDAQAVWMGEDSFYTFDGTVKSLPCDVQDFVFGDLNKFQQAKISCGVNTEFNEVWWFYPSKDSLECDRYVVWNHSENHWTIGALARTSWAPATVFEHPIAASPDGKLYYQENGWTNAGAPIKSERYVESGAVDLTPGNNLLSARRLVPDERTQGQTQITFKLRMAPNSDEVTVGPYEMSPFTDLRWSARQAAIRIEGTADADWRVGVPRLDAVPGGQR